MCSSDLGFFGAISQLISRESLRKAVLDSVPAAFAELNGKAYDAGYEYGLKHMQSGALDLGEEDPVTITE